MYIGYREDVPPMSFVDKNNQPAGYSIDLCSHIAKEVKAELKDPNIAIKYVPVTDIHRATSYCIKTLKSGIHRDNFRINLHFCQGVFKVVNRGGIFHHGNFLAFKFRHAVNSSGL